VEDACRTFLHRLDRLDAALAEAERRFRAPLAERDDLRGLLRAYNDKADESGLTEHPDLTVASRAAADLLWSAPCDLAEARRRVEHYIAAVNALTNGETPRVGNRIGDDQADQAAPNQGERP
ncbi:MAG TPA: hypothetical protein PLV68_11890, partial [Ilumatobacteraceae bacterium]|nr:hypothetical protein [Ilumatobacteraceae bacterium]